MEQYIETLSRDIASRSLRLGTLAALSSPALDVQAQTLLASISRLEALLQDSIINLESRSGPSALEWKDWTGLIESLYNTKASLHVLHLECPVVIRAAPRYDFDPECKANGYRSLLRVLQLTVSKLQVKTGASLKCVDVACLGGCRAIEWK